MKMIDCFFGEVVMVSEMSFGFDDRLRFCGIVLFPTINSMHVV
jgi:hypothetical protein